MEEGEEVPFLWEELVFSSLSVSYNSCFLVCFIDKMCVFLTGRVCFLGQNVCFLEKMCVLKGR